MAVALTGCQSTGQPFRLDSMLASRQSAKRPDSALTSNQLAPPSGNPVTSGLAAVGSKLPFVNGGSKQQWPEHPLMAQQKPSTIQRMRTTASSIVESISDSPSRSTDATDLAQDPGPIRPELHLSAARVMEQQGQLKQAQRHYAELLKVQPSNRQGLIGQARMHHRLGEMDQAIESYRLAIQRLGQDAVILNDLGLCLARSGRTDEAVGVLRTAVSSKPESVMYRNNLAAALVQANQHSQAVETLAVTHGPVLAHYNVAYLLNEKGSADLAHFHFNEALRENPDFDPARTMLDRIAPMVGKRQDPAKDFSSASSIPIASSENTAQQAAFTVPIDRESFAQVAEPALVADRDPAPFEQTSDSSLPAFEDTGMPDLVPPSAEVDAVEVHVEDGELGIGHRQLPPIRLPQQRDVGNGDPRMIAPAPAVF